MVSLSREEYERFIYSLPNRYPFISFSTLVVKPIGATVGKVEGKVSFHNGIQLEVLELIDFAKGRIVTYTYEIFKGEEKLYWYDPMEHPKDERLRASFPHHKHLPPDIKHHWLPAPILSFQLTNLDAVICEIRDHFSM